MAYYISILEGGGSRHTKEQRREKEAQEYANRGANKFPSFKQFDDINNYSSLAEERENRANELVEKHKRLDEDKSKVYQKHADNASKEADRQFSRNSSKVLGYDSERTEQISNKQHRRLNYNLDRLENYANKEQRNAFKAYNKIKQINKECGIFGTIEFV